MFIVRLADPKSSKKRVIGSSADVVLALPKGGSARGEHADDGKGVPAQFDHPPDRRLVREKAFLDRFPDEEHAPAEGDIFVIEVASVGEGVGVGGEEALVGSDDR